VTFTFYLCRPSRAFDRREEQPVTRTWGQPPRYTGFADLRDDTTARAYGIMVLTVRAGLTGEITGFADPSLFPLFGLPQQADWPVKLTGGTGGL
jgi:hypothetical protein